MPDIERENRVGDTNPGAYTDSSNWPAGCLSKKDIYNCLRPHSKSRYDTRTVGKFFTDDLLSRCGISREELKRIRVFPPEINFVIVTHLKTCRLL